MAELVFERWENGGETGIAVYANGSRAFNLKNGGGHMIGVDFGQPFTSGNFRQIADELDRLNGEPNTRALDERVKEFYDWCCDALLLLPSEQDSLNHKFKELFPVELKEKLKESQDG